LCFANSLPYFSLTETPEYHQSTRIASNALDLANSWLAEKIAKRVWKTGDAGTDLENRNGEVSMDGNATAGVEQTVDGEAANATYI